MRQPGLHADSHVVSSGRTVVDRKYEMSKQYVTIAYTKQQSHLRMRIEYAAHSSHYHVQLGLESGRVDKIADVGKRGGSCVVQLAN